MGRLVEQLAEVGNRHTGKQIVVASAEMDFGVVGQSREQAEGKRCP
jgi:hypothetical protein